MTEQATTAPAPKKKAGKFKKILVVTLGLAVLGGGGAGAALWAGLIPTGAGAAEDPNVPQLVPREGVSAAQIAAAREKAKTGRPDPRVFQPTYYPLEQSFTSNLRSGDAFVQIGLGVSTFYDERVPANLKAHEMAVRSAILMTLSEQDPVEIAGTEGKRKLKQALRDSINDVLTIREGFGGIDDVYFTSFVTQ